MSPLLVPFGADWDESVIEERAGLTSILMSEDGHEQRRCLRRRPRVTMEMTFSAENARLAALLQSLALSAAGVTVAAPAWPYAHELAVDVAGDLVMVDTTYTPWSRYAMLYQEDAVAELVEIETIGAGQLTLTAPVASSWPRGRTIVPCFEAWGEPDAQLRWLARNFIRWRPKFTFLAEDSPLWAGTADDGPAAMDVGDAPSREDESPLTIRRLLRRFDNPTGDRLDSDPYVARTQLDYEVVLLDPPAALELWTWLGGRLGRLNPAWVPTFGEDLPLRESVDPADLSVVIDRVEYDTLHGADSSRRWVALIDGVNAYTVRGVESVDVGLETETLNLNAAAGITVTLPHGYLSFAHYARLSDDTVRVDWVAPWVGRSRLTFIDLPHEPELEITS